MVYHSILGLTYLLAYVREQGIDTSNILRNYGLNESKLSPTGQIERARELEILCELYPLIAKPALGLTLGTQFGLAGYGPLAMLLMSSPTMYDACRTGMRYQKMGYLYGELHLELGQTEAAFTLTPDHLPEEIRSFIIERDIAGTYKLIKDIAMLINISPELKEVWLPCPKPACELNYRQFFNCPVLFDMPVGKLVTDQTFFASRSLPQANQHAFELYQTQCDKILLERSGETNNIAEQTLRHLKLFHYEFPSMPEVAKTFGLSERHFRRKLSEENIQFRTLLDKVRYEKASQLLSTSPLPIEVIANQLGYQEASSFNHAFLRWSGMTPSRYRNTYLPE